MTLHLNAFRGEPAIAEFDWSFAPYHSSSPPFSTDVCSDLHGVLPPLHPDHGKITRLRVYSMRLNALFRLAFAPATPLGLTSPHTVTRRLILQKARHRGCTLRCNDSLTACKPTVSGTISLPSRGSFHLSLTVLVHYRSPIGYLGLRGGPRGFMPVCSVPALLGIGLEDRSRFAYGAVTHCGPPFQVVLLRIGFVTSRHLWCGVLSSHDPVPATPPGCCAGTV